MIVRQLVVFSCLALLAGSTGTAQMNQAPPAKPKSYVISGVMVRQGSGQPLKKVNVTIADTQQQEKRASLTTSADGRFTFTDVPKGKYSLFAEMHGIVRTYQQDDAFSTAIAVGPSLDSEHIVFPLPSSTSLTVKVIDEENEAVRSAQVWLFRRHIAGGWSQIQMISQTNTDHAGTTRFAHLEPGTYYVGTGGRPWYAQERMQQPVEATPVHTSGDFDVAYPVTYYPETQDPNAASPIDVAEGDSKQVQIALRPVPAIHISLAGSEEANREQNGAQQQPVMNNVEAIGPGGIALFANGGPGTGIAPGRYRVSLTRFTPGQNFEQGASGSTIVNATSDLELSAADFPKTEVAGHLSIEGGGNQARLPGIWLGQPNNGQHAYCQAGADGAFRCRANRGGGNGNLPGGRYEIQLANTEEFYIKSLDVKGAAFAGGMLDVQDGASVNISIVVAKGVTTLDGVAVKAERAVSGAMVLLVPQTLDQGVGIPRDQSDSDGTFTLHGVHPGKYWLLAIDNGHDLEYHNPKVIQPYLAAAKSIQISAAGSDPVQAPVQKRR